MKKITDTTFIRKIKHILKNIKNNINPLDINKNSKIIYYFILKLIKLYKEYINNIKNKKKNKNYISYDQILRQITNKLNNLSINTTSKLKSRLNEKEKEKFFGFSLKHRDKNKQINYKLENFKIDLILMDVFRIQLENEKTI